MKLPHFRPAARFGGAKADLLDFLAEQAAADDILPLTCWQCAGLIDELIPLRRQLREKHPALDQRIRDTSYACRNRPHCGDNLALGCPN